MKNVFLLLKANKIMRKDILGKRKWVFYFGLFLMLVGTAIIFYVSLSEKTGGGEFGASVTFLMQFQLFSILLFVMDGFVASKNFGGQGTQRTEDTRDYFFHLPFEFSDFIIAGLILLWRSFIISAAVSSAYALAAYFLGESAESRGLISFALILNNLEYLLLSCAFLVGAFGRKRGGKAVAVLYFSSIFMFIAGIFATGFFEGKLGFTSVLSPICSPAGVLLSLLPVPVSGIAAWILLKICKKGAWYNA